MKKILTLLCMLTVFLGTFAETKTYQLCTDLTEILNPDNQFLIVSAHGMKVSNVTSIYAVTTTPASAVVLQSATDTKIATPAELRIDAADKNLGFFSFKPNGEGTYALYLESENKYIGLPNSNALNTSETCSGNDYILTVSIDESTGALTVKSNTIATLTGTNERFLGFSNGTAFKSYKKSSVTAMPLFYKEVNEGPKDPVYGGIDNPFNIAFGDKINVSEIFKVTPAELTYNFEVEDESVIKIEGGVVTALKVGETTVNFTTEEVKDAFNAGSGSFTVNVVKATPVMSFDDDVVYGKLGVGVVWDAVRITGPENVNSESESVKYTSSDTEIVVVDEITGQIRPEDVKTAGTVTITATFEGDENFESHSTSYKIIIIDADATDVPPATDHFDFTSEPAYGMSVQTGSDYETTVKKITDNVNDKVSLTFDGNYRLFKSTATATYGNISLRIQKNASLKVNVPDNYEITKIGFIGNINNPTYNPASKTSVNSNDDKPEEWSEEVFDTFWVPKADAEPTSTVTIAAGSNTQDIYQLYVQYQLKGTGLKTPELSFDKHIYAIYAGEEAEVNVANNSHDLDVHYSIRNLDADKYTITEDADKLLVTVSEPGYYTLEAKTDADETYRDGFAILRLNVYRHLDIDVDGIDLTEDVVNTSKDVTVNIENLDLVDVYYQIVEKGKEPVSADDDPKSEEDENREPGFKQAGINIEGKYFVDIEQGTEGELLFYIANYGYISPIRHIKLEDTRKEMSATFSVDDEMIYSTDDLVEIPVLFTPGDTNDFPVATTFTLYEVGKEGAEKVDTDLYEMESNGAKVEGMISKAGVYTLVAEWKNDELYKDGETTSKAITIYAASMIGNNNKGVHIEGENVPEFVAPVEGSKVKTTALVFPEGSSDNKIKLSMNGADALYYFVVPVSSEDLNKPKTIDEAVAENQNPEGVENHFSKYDDAEGITLAGEHGRLHVQNITNGVVSPVEEALYTNDASKLADIETGVALVEIENGEAVYFDLNGVRVDAENIAPGIYVRVANGAAAKVLVK